MDALQIPVLATHSVVDASLALIYHPTLYTTATSRPMPVRPDKVAIVAHHPPRNAAGDLEYDVDAAIRNVRDIHRRTPIILPVGPNVRDSFNAEGRGNLLHREDWINLIDSDDWPVHSPRGEIPVLIVGRHTRPDPLKWPDPVTARRAYPECAKAIFRHLGVDAHIRKLFDPWPGNWRAIPFVQYGVGEFLRTLDAYAYFHSALWVEAFGYNVLEALATGLPTVVPSSFERLFGDAAIYATPEEAEDTYERLRADPVLRARMSAHARRTVATRFGYKEYGVRLLALMGDASRRAVACGGVGLRPPHRPDVAMAVTSNGIGAGHLVRQIAIARAQPIDLQTIFFSLSLAVCFARQAGYLTEYRPFHRQLGLSHEIWNPWFRQEVSEAIRFYEPQAVIFDGNMPYMGLLEALDEFPRVSRIWVRRGLWRHADPKVLKRSERFHLVIEPGELCAAADPGLMPIEDDCLVRVAPILLVAPCDRMSRATARRLLGLPEAQEIALLQLGAGTNFDMSAARAQALDTLLSDPERHVVELVHPLAGTEPERVNSHHHLRSVFPAFKYQRAFDFAISAAGYNTFHEAVAGALPTLFIPNNAGEMDLQERRAEYGQICGWCLAAGAQDAYAIDRNLRRLMDAGGRRAIREACEAVQETWDGAHHAARLIAVVARQAPVLS
jgi:hypothetical protein